MVASFGSVSSKVVEPDRLGRLRRILTVTPLGPNWAATSGVLRYDAEDLDYLLRDEQAARWPGVAFEWPDVPARRWLPWAVVHQALPAGHVAHVHADAACTIANAPGGRSVVGELFGNEVAWLPYATPGPGLAKAIVEHDAGGCALVQHLGLFAWGDDLDDLKARTASIEAAAAGWLDARAGAVVHSDAPAMPDSEAECLLGTIRGLMSKPHRVVLSLDASMRSIAERDDVDALARRAPGAELTWPWSAGAVVVRGTQDVDVAFGPFLADPLSTKVDGGSLADASPGTAAAPRVALVPGVGQVSAGRDLSDADLLGAVAAHVHRVTAALIDLFGTFEALSGDESAELESALDRAPEVDAEPFRGRVYIVTGAASGIGRDIARHLATNGAQLGLGDINAQALDQIADELEPEAGRPVTVAGDLTDEAVVDHLVRATTREFGGIDGAVLNAGVATPGELKNLPAADWRRTLEVNTTSHFLLAKRLLPVLEAQRLGGCLVFIGSKNMFSPGAGFGAYSASKAALAQLARTVAIEAGPFGVRSNIVSPDNVFEGSALWSPELRAQRAAVYGISPDQLEAYYTQRNLLKVPITGLDVAKAVAFLLSDEAMRTTACILTVDGGVPGVFPR